MNLCSAAGSRGPSTVPRIRTQKSQRNADNPGILQREQRRRLNQDAAALAVPMMLGLTTISASELEQAGRQSADRALGGEPPPEDREQDHRQIGRRRHRKRQPHQERHVERRPQQNRDRDRNRAHHERRDPRHPHLLQRVVRLAVVDHVGVEIVREGSGCADGQPGHHRQNRGERDRADEREEYVARQTLRQQRRAHIDAAVLRDERLADDRRRAEAEERRHDVERADDHHRPHHADARGLRIGHGVEADQNVRQSGGAEDQRETQRDQIERAVGRLVAQARLSGS